MRKSRSAYYQTFSWNSLGQLTQMTLNGVTVAYGYDGFGRRMRRSPSMLARYH
jgi:YD repeat-containing protein